MATLSEADRIKLWVLFMRTCSNFREKLSITKSDIKAAIDAADQWAEDNDVSYNTALPAAARNNLNSKQKARLLMEVIKRRYEVT